MVARVQVPVRKFPEGFADSVTVFLYIFLFPLCIRESVCVH